ncbi:MAG: hypothetical protein JZU49_05490 [Sulfuricurvum sp.]|nr:hypothetical protein [Sulfuricurvum sp.]
MVIYILYICILIFIVIFAKLFIENFNTKNIPLVPKPEKGNYPLRIKIEYAFIRSFIRAILFSSTLFLIFWILYELLFFLYIFFQNLSEIFIALDYKTIKDFGIKNYNSFLNLPADTYYASLIIASFFAVYAIISFIFVYIKNFIVEVYKEVPSFKEFSKKEFKLDKKISKSLNPSLDIFDSFQYSKLFIYKKFTFSENVGHILSIMILWKIHDNQSLNVYILIISLLIISYSSMLRVIGEYLYIIKEELKFIHKIQIYIVSVLIPILTIILGFFFLEKNSYYLIYGLIATALYSFTLLNFGEKIKEKAIQLGKQDIIDTEIFKQFINSLHQK